jgi:putative ABC transport system permease protein
MLIILIGGGQGLKELLAKNFEGFASNTMLVFADKTTKAYDGFRKGRQWNTTDVDVERLRHQVPELDVVTPMVFANSTTIVYGDKKSTGSIKGVSPDYEKVQASKIFYGRTLNEMDEQKARKVCIIGKKI